ncbi:DNA polymerase III subunit beta [Pontibacillus yanchengensis]|uniref:DNA polymerase III subunit beta n=2 Tax=Pontibacillus yanchengensis TaxID=462910 RepID=A0ACC7VLK3_9BACI|nr:DNA polymerase III subunit beta [Pontibacillus yanchengensis]MYL35468.1 DNA polymerase III subunit beta [Pontibacillus yanchengensis]MYL55668.1 DNA polymerase III subunit beta [Pontibacillus yanchengensis]
MSVQMKVKEVSKFNELLMKAAGAADKKSTTLTNGILVQAKGTQVELLATDSNSSIRVAGDEVVETDEDVTFWVPLMFVDMMKKLPKGDVVLDIQDSKVDIKVKKSSYSIATSDASEFPKKSFETLAKSFTINGDQLSESLKAVLHSIAVSETRPILTGVQLKSDGNGINVAATDSHRLFVHRIKLDEEIDQIDNLVLPGVAVKEMIKLCEGEGDMKIEYEDAVFKLSTENMTYSTRLLDGSYPPIDRLIPKEFEAEAVIHREECIQAIERVKTAVGKEKKTISIKLNGGTLPTLSVKANSDITNVNEELFIDDVSAEFEFGINFHYLQECLKSIQTKEIRFKSSGQNKPIIVRPVNEESENEGYDQFGLILPVRVAQEA